MAKFSRIPINLDRRLIGKIYKTGHSSLTNWNSELKFYMVTINIVYFDTLHDFFFIFKVFLKKNFMGKPIQILWYLGYQYSQFTYNNPQNYFYKSNYPNKIYY